MFPWKYNRVNCTYDQTISVAGTGTFFFDYRSPYLYVTDQGASSNSVFKIYDISNPFSPVLKSTTSLPLGCGAVHPKAHAYGNRLVCLIPYFLTKKLAIWNVADPTTPVLLGEVSTSAGPWSVAAIGANACVGFSENFLQAKSAARVNITDPTVPVVEVEWTASKLVERVRASADHFFLSGQNNSAGPVHLTALRLSDFGLASAATDGGSFAGTGAGALAMNAACTRAFTVNMGNAALASWDTSNPGAISFTQLAAVLGATSGTACIALKEDASRCYVGRGSGGGLQVDIINVSNPAAMTFAGAINTAGNSVADVGIIEDGCNGLAYGVGNGGAIHLVGTPPLS